MNCMKCGREIDEDQVFCRICLDEMQTYPVKPGIAIHIPSREQEEPPKKHHKRRKPAPTMAEQLLRLKKRVIRLRILVAILLLLCCGLSFVVVRTVEELDLQRMLGRNYNAVVEIVDALTDHGNAETATEQP